MSKSKLNKLLGPSSVTDGLSCTAQTSLPNLSRRELRRLLTTIFRSSIELNAFICDSFPDVYQRLPAGMDSMERITQLLQQVDASEICAQLLEARPDALEQLPERVTAADLPPDCSLPDAAGIPCQIPPQEDEPAPARIELTLAWPSQGSSVELLAELAKSQPSSICHDLVPKTILGGWRRISLRPQDHEICLEAFPALVTIGGDSPLRGGCRIPPGPQTVGPFRYLPSGPLQPGYVLYVHSGALPSLELTRQDVSILFSFRPMPAKSFLRPHQANLASPSAWPDKP